MPKNLKDQSGSTLQINLKLKKKRNDNAGCQSIELFFHRKEQIKRFKALKAISNELGKVKEAPIAIPYRNDSDGRGALYDHRSIQAAAKMPTGVLNQGNYNSNLKFQIEHFQYQMKFGEQTEGTVHKYPPLFSEFITNYGLLILPGVSAKDFSSPDYAERKAYEMSLIHRARMVGQPILGICGGSWVLYQAYGGNITEVTDHAYRAGMPRLSETTGKIGNNKQIHRIAIRKDENLLRAALEIEPTDDALPVNSVHSYAPDMANVPPGIEITAISVQDDELAPISSKSNNLDKEKMKPQAGTIEAFESSHGTPVLGVQWHPEAYSNKNDEIPFSENHLKLIAYMALAGQTFLNKKTLLNDLKNNVYTVKQRLRQTELLRYNQTVVRHSQNGYFRFDLFRLKATDELRHQHELISEIRKKEDYCEERNAINAKRTK